MESQLQTLSEQQMQTTDMFSDLFKHQGITSSPRSTSQAEPTSRALAASVISSLFTTSSRETVAIAPAMVTTASQAEQPAAKPIFDLRRYDNSSQYSLITKNFTVSQATSDWIKYKLSSASKKGSGFSTTSNVDHIPKMECVVTFAISIAEELAAESYRVLHEAEPHEK